MNMLWLVISLLRLMKMGTNMLWLVIHCRIIKVFQEAVAAGCAIVFLLQELLTISATVGVSAVHIKLISGYIFTIYELCYRLGR